MFSKHENVDLNLGTMVTPQKPGKPQGPLKNLRALTLLKTIRKSLSLIVLTCIRPAVSKYVSRNQSGFTPDRSTADVVWTHRFLAAKVSISKGLHFRITGADMSAAFDTINRHILLDILRDIVQEDEHRIIRFLLSNTEISVKVNGTEEKITFMCNTGAPQGDGLSPVLFIVYLEHALKSVRPSIGISPEYPDEIAYADDVDFVDITTYRDVEEVQSVLKPFSLFVNTDKTEYTDVVREADREKELWRKSKKVGSLIGDDLDVGRRKSLAIVAMNKMSEIWLRGEKVNLEYKLRLYRSLVKSVLLYNCSTWGLTKAETDKLDAFHRKQLRRLLGIRWPTKITNANLYKKCHEVPISLTMLTSRWKLLGHILRRDKDIPANKAMTFYFKHMEYTNFVGHARTTLPVVLNQDLNRLSMFEYGDHQYMSKLKFNTLADLEHLRKLAEDRQGWRDLTGRIQRAAQAAYPVGFAAEEH